MPHRSDVVPVSRLKGASVYYENDLYEFALLKLTLNDARARHDRSTAISRPTVNGLAKLFAQFIDACYPDYDIVSAVIEELGFPLGATVRFDGEEDG